MTTTDATAMPRRIWIEPECCAGGDVTEQRWAEDDIFDCDEGAGATEYVRADLVAEMREALSDIASGSYSGVSLTSYPPKDPAVERARAALAKAKGGDDA